MTAGDRGADRGGERGGSGDREYVARLGGVLRQRDVASLRAFLQDQAGRYGDQQQVDAIRQQSDAEIEALLHRMILARADLRDLHPASERWLADQGGQPDRRQPPGPRQRRRGDPRGRSDGRRNGASGDGPPRPGR